MDINNIVFQLFEEGFNPKEWFKRRFKKYGATRSGRVRGHATHKAALNAYRLGYKHGKKDQE